MIEESGAELDEAEEVEQGSSEPEGSMDAAPPIEAALPTVAPPSPGRAFRAVLVVASLGLVATGAFLVLRPGGQGNSLTPEAIRPSGASTDVSSGSTGSASAPGSKKGKGSPLAPNVGSTPDSDPDPDAGKPHGSLKFEVKLIPECVSPGAPMRAEITTTPGAAITLAVVYKDGQTYGQWGTFRADPQGRFIYPWTVPAVAPEGLGRFLAGGDDESLQQSAAGYWNFTVADVGQC